MIPALLAINPTPCVALVRGKGSLEGSMYAQDKTFTVVAKRPVLSNSITNLVSRPDLASRCILIELEPLAFTAASDTLGFRLKDDAPKLFGALLDVMAKAELLLDEVRCSANARGAGFNRYGEAFCQAMGYASGVFSAERERRARIAEEEAIADSPIKAMIEKIMDGRDEWRGTSALFLAECQEIMPSGFFSFAMRPQECHQGDARYQ